MDADDCVKTETRRAKGGASDEAVLPASDLTRSGAGGGRGHEEALPVKYALMR